MSETKRSGSYLGIGSEWAQRVAADKLDWLVAFENTDCLIEYWALRYPDTQTTHDRDEVYVIVAGRGDLDMNDQMRSVRAGDLIFVPAGMLHRFVGFSSDFAMWIVFFGPTRKIEV